jgi:hypothetical protein
VDIDHQTRSSIDRDKLEDWLMTGNRYGIISGFLLEITTSRNIDSSHQIFSDKMLISYELTDSVHRKEREPLERGACRELYGVTLLSCMFRAKN